MNKARVSLHVTSLLLLMFCFNYPHLRAQDSGLSRDALLSSASHSLLNLSPSSVNSFDRSANFAVDFPVASPTIASFDLEPPRNVGPNRRVSALLDLTKPRGDRRGRSETTIASDRSGQFLLVGWNDAEGFLFAPFGQPPGLGLSGFGFSADGGKTWTDGGAPFIFPGPGGVGVVTRGDPWMDTGGPGQKTYYYANLAIFEDGSGGGLSVHRGGFSGKKFAFNHAVFIPPPNPNDFLDKEALCAGHTSMSKDLVSVSVTNFTGPPTLGNGQIEVFTSKNRATSFPVRGIAQADEIISGVRVVQQGSACGIGPQGEVYVVWERGWLSPFIGQGGIGVFPKIFFARSEDSGMTFKPRVLVSDISSGALFPPSGYTRNRIDDFPRMCVATNEDDPFFGRIYVVYKDSRVANGGPQPAALGPEDIAAGTGFDVGHAQTDIYLRFSDDRGDSWSGPMLVASAGSGKIDFWPVVSCNSSDGTVDVVWYESVEPEGTEFLNGAPPFGFNDSLVDVFYAASTDGGITFSTPLRVTDVTSNWNRNVTPTNINPNFGDYIGMVSKSNRVMVTWADGRSGFTTPPPDIRQPEVFYATVGVGNIK
jgi:hypothetical protein